MLSYDAAQIAAPQSRILCKKGLQNLKCDPFFKKSSSTLLKAYAVILMLWEISSACIKLVTNIWI